MTYVHRPYESRDQLIADLSERLIAAQAEIKLLKSKLEVIDLWTSIPTEDHTWQQERTAVVKWLGEMSLVYVGTSEPPWRILEELAENIKSGEHWTKDGESK
jgi:hypothetical protein